MKLSALGEEMPENVIIMCQNRMNEEEKRRERASGRHGVLKLHLRHLPIYTNISHHSTFVYRKNNVKKKTETYIKKYQEKYFYPQISLSLLSFLRFLFYCSAFF